MASRNRPKRPWIWIGLAVVVLVVLNAGVFGLLSAKRSLQGDELVVAVSPDAPEALQRELTRLGTEYSGKLTVVSRNVGGAVSVFGQQRQAIDLHITASPDAINDPKELIPLTSEQLVIVTNALNPVPSVSETQLQQLLRGEIANWHQLGGPDMPVHWLALPKDHPASVWAQVELGRWPQEAKVCPDLPALEEELAKRSGALAYLPTSMVSSPARPLTIKDAKGQPVEMVKTWYAVAPRSQQTLWQKLMGLERVVHQQRVNKLLKELDGLAVTASPKRQVTLAAVGDIMLARQVTGTLESKGFDYPLASAKAKLEAADVRFGNLESPLGTGGTPIPGKGIWYRGKPEALETVVRGRFDIINLANNHILDYDTALFNETLTALDQKKIAHIGAGQNLDEARAPVIVEKNGLRIGFLGYSDMAEIFWDYSYPRMFAATDEVPGIAPLRREMILEDIAKLKKKVDLVVVSLHWGEEYQNVPTPAQKELAHDVVDAGACLVLGHHPHAIQGVEFYDGAVIAYSLGNFITDQQFDDIVRESMVTTFTLTPEGVVATEVLPAFLTDHQPRLLTGEAGRLASEKIIRISEAIYER